MRFTHLRDDSGVPFATIAQDYRFNRAVYGAAICSGHDQFNRKIGRAIASGRLEKGLSNTPDSPRYVVYDGRICSATELVNLYIRLNDLIPQGNERALTSEA